MLRNGVLCKSVTFSLPDMKLKVPISIFNELISKSSQKRRSKIDYVGEIYWIPLLSTTSHTSPGPALAYSGSHPHLKLYPAGLYWSPVPAQGLRAGCYSCQDMQRGGHQSGRGRLLLSGLSLILPFHWNFSSNMCSWQNETRRWGKVKGARGGSGDIKSPDDPAAQQLDEGIPNSFEEIVWVKPHFSGNNSG